MLQNFKNNNKGHSNQRHQFWNSKNWNFWQSSGKQGRFPAKILTGKKMKPINDAQRFSLFLAMQKKAGQKAGKQFPMFCPVFFAGKCVKKQGIMQKK